MRLIDADELNKKAHICLTKDVAPTVEAVPMSVIEGIRAEIKEWYWQADKQAIAKDPCVVDAMVDLFIRTINKYKAESEEENNG